MSDQTDLIKRVLGQNYLQLALVKLSVDEDAGEKTTVRAKIGEGDQQVDVEGTGVGVVDALYAGLLDRYAREYKSLESIEIVDFKLSADMGSKQRTAGVDALGKVTLDVTNSEGKHFTFADTSRSVTTSSARAVIACVQYFLNAERAFVTLFNARKDAIQRGREDLVSRYTAELAEVVQSTSYAEVIANMRKQL
ncbi:MAG: alpha-isopropylmalate synthase regulatory domain-containing protein [Kofleriaceae bacterium]